jgi:hypothetical protein
MRRALLVLGLVLSVGVNLGLIGAAALRQRRLDREAPPRERLREMLREPLRERLGPPGAHLADRLRLEGDVRERFLVRQRELAAKVRELRPRIGDLERELRRELAAAEPDRTRIDAIPGELAALQSALDRAFAESVLATREILDGDAEREYVRFVERFPGPRRGFGDGRPPRD